MIYEMSILLPPALLISQFPLSIFNLIRA